MHVQLNFITWYICTHTHAHIQSILPKTYLAGAHVMVYPGSQTRLYFSFYRHIYFSLFFFPLPTWILGRRDILVITHVSLATLYIIARAPGSITIYSHIFCILSLYSCYATLLPDLVHGNNAFSTFAYPYGQCPQVMMPIAADYDFFSV